MTDYKVEVILKDLTKISGTYNGFTISNDILHLQAEHDETTYNTCMIPMSNISYILSTPCIDGVEIL